MRSVCVLNLLDTDFNDQLARQLVKDEYLSLVYCFDDFKMHHIVNL